MILYEYVRHQKHGWFGGWVWTPISLENEQAKIRGSREGIMYIEGRNYFEGRGKINILELGK
jgi:hypothetical protein